MDKISIGFKFAAKNGSKYVISDVWKRHLLDLTSPLQVTISDTDGCKIISMNIDEAINEIHKGRWKIL